METQSKLRHLFCLTVLVGQLCYAQFDRFDPNNVFKTEDGKVITLEEFEELTKDRRFELDESIQGETKVYTVRIKEDWDLSKIQQVEIDFEKRLLNQIMPQFSLKDINGNVRTNKDYEGKPTVYVFWATSSKPSINTVYQAALLKDQTDSFNVIGVSFEDHEIINGFIENKNLTLSTLTSSQELNDTLGINVLPTYLVVNESGVIKDVVVGFKDRNLLEIVKKAIQ